MGGITLFGDGKLLFLLSVKETWGNPAAFYKAGSYTECIGATARIVDVITGEVLIGVVYDTTRVTVKWHRPNQIGEALATGLKYGLWKQSQLKPVR